MFLVFLWKVSCFLVYSITRKYYIFFCPVHSLTFFFQFTIDMLSPDTAYKITVTGNSTSGESTINSTNVSTGKL